MRCPFFIVPDGWESEQTLHGYEAGFRNEEYAEQR
jgi:hypothetical protein